MLEVVQVLEIALNLFHMTSETTELSCITYIFFPLTRRFIDLKEGLLTERH